MNRLFKKILPVSFLRTLLKIESLAQSNQIKENKRIIENSSFDNDCKKTLNKLAAYGNRYAQFIKTFIDIKMDVTDIIDGDDVVVISMVKDDLMRMQMFMEHYRKIGIKRFAIVDDNSTDGTLQYLKKQKDIMLFSSDVSYTTLNRQVWINRIIHKLGYNRWYIVVDSDELFDCPYNDINQYIEYLENINQSRSKAFLIDMLAEDDLYTGQNIDTYEDIEKIYNYIYPYFYYEKNVFDKLIKGGARDALFFKDNKESSPVVCKYPLIYVLKDDILINSHYNFPFNKNLDSKPDTILRHYKFLPKDKKDYQIRADKGNFGLNSIQYKIYNEKLNEIDYQIIKDKIIRYEGISSLKDIRIEKGN